MSHMNLILAWLVLLPRGNGKFIKMRIMNLIRPCVMNQLKGMLNCSSQSIGCYKIITSTKTVQRQKVPKVARVVNQV